MSRLQTIYPSAYLCMWPTRLSSSSVFSVCVPTFSINRNFGLILDDTTQDLKFVSECESFTDLPLCFVLRELDCCRRGHVPLENAKCD